MAVPPTIDVLAGPWPVLQVEPPADGIHHELGVAGVDVELATVAAIAVGDGDPRLDRAREMPSACRRRPYSANAAAACLPGVCGGTPTTPASCQRQRIGVMGCPFRNCSLTVHLTVAQPRPGVTTRRSRPGRQR